MKVGFTGSRHGMTYKQKQEFSAFLEYNRSKITQLHMGHAQGADTDASILVRKLLPKVKIVSHPPKDTRLESDFEADIVLPRKDYLVRNQDIVDICDILVATPETSEEQLRSGTWATIRRAKKANKQVLILNPR